MGVPLKNPPVYFTVAQVKFNAVLKLSEFLPTIQERFRLNGYPDYQAGQVMVFELIIDNGGKPVPKQHIQEVHAFRNIEKTVSFVLETEKLTLQSTSYGRFEDFSAKFLKGMAIVHDAVNLDFVDRVGMRYLDRVWPASDDHLEDYLVPEARALSRVTAGIPLRSMCEALNKFGEVQVLSRVLTLDSALAFPPDMIPGDMAIDPRFSAFTGRHAILDFDGFREGRESFSAESVGKHLTTIHDHITEAFHATVTPHAMTVWNR
jgi:uncharacterized protein (TIGR04255 family)